MDIVHMQKQQMAILELEEDEDGMRVPNWLVEVLAFITRREIVQSSMNTSARIFEQLCWPKLHGNIQPHNVPYLFISREKHSPSDHHPQTIMKGKAKTGNGLELIPITSVAPPDYIAGFDWITICFLDEQILQFVEYIAPLFKNCTLKFITNLQMWKKGDERVDKMHKLMWILASKMSMIYFMTNKFTDFRRLFPEIVAEMQNISIYEFTMDLEMFDYEPIFEWLQKGRIDGKQKILHLRTNALKNADLERIKKEFSASIHQSNFIIWQQKFDENDFEMENEQTGEILTLYQNIRGHRYLARFPKGEDRWKEEGEEKMWPLDEESSWIMLGIGEEFDKDMNASFVYPTWDLIKTEILKILRKEKLECNYGKLYRLIYTMVLQHYSDVLYSGLKRIIGEHLRVTIRCEVMESIEEEHFAETLNAVWNNHKSSMTMIRDVYLYLDRIYSSNADILGIYQLGMEIFGAEIVDYPPINEHLKSEFGGDLARGRGKIEASLIELILERIL